MLVVGAGGAGYAIGARHVARHEAGSAALTVAPRTAAPLVPTSSTERVVPTSTTTQATTTTFPAPITTLVPAPSTLGTVSPLTTTAAPVAPPITVALVTDPPTTSILCPTGTVKFTLAPMQTQTFGLTSWDLEQPGTVTNNTTAVIDKGYGQQSFLTTAVTGEPLSGGPVTMSYSLGSLTDGSLTIAPHQGEPLEGSLGADSRTAPTSVGSPSLVFTWDDPSFSLSCPPPTVRQG